MKHMIAAAAVVTLLALAAGPLAQATHRHAATGVTVVMHDPGCHWFSVGGKLSTKLAVKGPVRLLDVDEAALRVVGAGKVQRDRVGRTILLGKGTYAITMIGQAPDDNHLRLVVR